MFTPTSSLNESQQKEIDKEKILDTNLKIFSSFVFNLLKYGRE